MISLQLGLFGLSLGVSVVAFGASVWSSVKSPTSSKRFDSSSSPPSQHHPGHDMKQKAPGWRGNPGDQERFYAVPEVPPVKSFLASTGTDVQKGNW
jgi:hypothetical protein